MKQEAVFSVGTQVPSEAIDTHRTRDGEGWDLKERIGGVEHVGLVSQRERCGREYVFARGDSSGIQLKVHPRGHLPRTERNCINAPSKTTSRSHTLSLSLSRSLSLTHTLSQSPSLTQHNTAPTQNTTQYKQHPPHHTTPHHTTPHHTTPQHARTQLP